MLTTTPALRRSRKSRHSRWGKALAVFLVLLALLTAVITGLYFQLRGIFQPQGAENAGVGYAAEEMLPQYTGPVQLQSSQSQP